jgi:hypothetical protein
MVFVSGVAGLLPASPCPPSLSDLMFVTKGGADMKINIDIDCTPEEARTFLGLPDVKPLQEAMLVELDERMRANLQAMDSETMFKTWMPAGVPSGVQGWEQMQRMFWANLAGKDDDEKKD